MASSEEELSLDDAQAWWTRVRERLLEEVGEVVFNRFLGPITLIDTGRGRVQLGVGTRFMRDYVRKEFSEPLHRLWRQERPDVVMVDVTTVAMSASAAATGGLRAGLISQTARPLPSSAPPAAPVAAPLTGLPLRNPTGLIPSYSFENFVAGPSNAIAYEAAKRVAEAPGTRYNPLFLHSATGLGKTHLLHAIGNAVLANRPGARVLYLSAERFLCLFLGAMRTRDGLAFKEQFRSADVLLVDDLHYLAGGSKEVTRTEFTHTLNSLIDDNRQVVLAAEQGPATLQGIDESMRSRLTGGMVLDIGDSDFEIRLGILRGLANRFAASQTARKSLPVAFAPDVLPFMAEKLVLNGRDLSGAFNRVSGKADIEGVPVTIDFVHHTLKDLLQGADRPCSIDQIQHAVAAYTTISVQDQRSARRTQNIVLARHMAFWLCRRLTERSYPQIAHRFGGRDHTTVIAGVRRIERLRANDAKLVADLDAITQILKRSV